MSNADLIERLRESMRAGNLTDEAADALAAADKRIAELEKYGRVQDPLADRIAELERKLAVAREAMEEAHDASLDEDHRACRLILKTALAQIGGEDEK